MPPRSDDVFHRSGRGLTVTAHLLPGAGRCIRVCLAGEVDAAAGAVLADTIDWLRAGAPVGVLVDLAELTFASTTLPNFFVRVRQLLPRGAGLMVCGAGPATERVLRVTDPYLMLTHVRSNVDA